METNNKKVLILRFSSLGDVIIANFTVKKVKELHPDWHITWIVDKLYSEILEMQPWVDEIITWNRHAPDGGKKEYKEILINARKVGYDILLDLHATDRSSIFSLFSGIPVRYGARKHFPFAHTTIDITPFAGSDRVSDSKNYLLVSKDYSEKLRPILSAGGIKLALVIGASYKAKRWSSTQWVRFCRLAAKDGIKMFLFGGSKEEKSAADEIVTQVNSELIVNLADQLSLKELIQAISLCDAAVSCDTGPLHIARALGVPVAAMFGPSTLTDKDYMNSLKYIYKVDCPESPCGRHECSKPCIDTISPDIVYDCVRKIIDKKYEVSRR